MLDTLVQTVEGGIYRLGKKLWRDDPLLELREEAGRLSEELQRRYSALEKSRAEREALARRLAHEEVHAAMLVSRVETYVHVNDPANAWHHALELDHVRRVIRHDRAQFRQHEETYRYQRARIQEIEGRLANLLEHLYPR
jgi:hypothetical protein